MLILFWKKKNANLSLYKKLINDYLPFFQRNFASRIAFLNDSLQVFHRQNIRYFLKTFHVNLKVPSFALKPKY